MHSVRLVAVAAMGILVTMAAHAAAYTYSKSGAPAFPHFKIHVTTYDQIRAALGPPAKEADFDAEGNPGGAAFIIPSTGAGGVQAWQCVFLFVDGRYNGVACNPTTLAARSK